MRAERQPPSEVGVGSPMGSGTGALWPSVGMRHSFGTTAALVFFLFFLLLTRTHTYRHHHHHHAEKSKNLSGIDRPRLRQKRRNGWHKRLHVVLCYLGMGRWKRVWGGGAGGGCLLTRAWANPCRNQSSVAMPCCLVYLSLGGHPPTHRCVPHSAWCAAAVLVLPVFCEFFSYFYFSRCYVEK